MAEKKGAVRPLFFVRPVADRDQPSGGPRRVAIVAAEIASSFDAILVRPATTGGWFAAAMRGRQG